MISKHPALGARLARACDIALGAVAGSLLFAMMALTFTDVVMRYLFNAKDRKSVV